MQRFAPEPLGPPPQDPVQAMAHRLKTPEGRALYALRKSTDVKRMHRMQYI